MKTLITTTLLLIALYTNAQVRKIETDSLHINGLKMKKPYVFYYTDEYISFGEKGEKTEDYSLKNLTKIKEKDLLGRIYFVYVSDDGYTVFIREDNKEIMFIGEEGKSLMFY